MTVLQAVLLSFYTFLNRLGCFEIPWVRALFTTFYFSYKRLFENGFSSLIRTHPEIFQQGNIIDVGANIGYTSYLFAQALTPTFKVLAFEPEKRNFLMLNETLKRHGIQDLVVPYAKAVGSRTATERLWINKTNDADHRILTPEFSGQTNAEDGVQEVQVVSLDDVLSPGGNALPVSFIKIDVQGYEWPVCQGMTTTLEKNPRAVVAIEYCPDLLQKLGFDPRAVLDFFLSRGYLSYQLSNAQGLAAIDLQPFLEGKKTPYYVDLLFAKRSLM